MAWRKVTESDLLSALSGAEVEAFRRSADFETDPVASLLADTVAHVRGCIRTGGAARLDPDETTLPASLVRPATNYLRYELLTRHNLVPNDARKATWEKSLELFEQVRSGKYVPESYSADETAPTAGPAVAVVSSTRKRVSAEKLEGL